MLNCYAGLDDLTQSMKGGSSAVDKAVALRVLEAVSRAYDRGLEWQFFDEKATAYFDGNGYGTMRLRSAAVVRGGRFAGLLSVTSLKVDEDEDGVYERTLVANTDYALRERFDDGPYRAVRILARSAQVHDWYLGDSSVEITGTFGWSSEVEAAGTLGAAITDTTGTSVTMVGGHSVQAGNTILVDSEYLFVSAVSTNTLTVVRGVNGTTAATHLNNAAVSRRRYPRPIELGVVAEAARLIRDGLTGFSGQVANADFAGYAFNAVYPAIRDLKASFHPTGMAVAV